MIQHEWPLSDSQIEQAFDADLVTFDFFDTLACRPKAPNFQFKVYGRMGKALRELLELSWRAIQKLGVKREFELEFLKPIFGSKIHDEFELDLENIVLRKSVANLMFELHDRGARILIVSNTYYSQTQMRTICRKLGIPENIPLVLSSDYGLTKSQGLFQASTDINCVRHWHFGDDRKEDLCVSKDVFVYVKKIVESNSFFDGTYYLSPKSKLIPLGASKTILNVMVEFENERDPWFWFGVLFSGPIAISISDALIKVADTQESALICFLSRDGYLPYRYLQILGNSHTKYVPYSRAISSSKRDVSALADFIQEHSFNTSKIIFDLGWRGLSASVLRAEFQGKGQLVLLGRWPWHRKKEDLSLFAGPWWTLRRAVELRRCPELIELALSAPHESLMGLPQNLDDWMETVRFGDEHPKSRIARGAEAYFFRHLEGSQKESDLRLSLKPLLRLIRKPSAGFLALAAGIFHDFGGKRVPLVSTESEPVMFWIKGSWKFQAELGVPFWTRCYMAISELIRRVDFRKGIQI
jgi:hypothetical protein